jgi:formylglycine-generating enzyme required for sulfatase activity
VIGLVLATWIGCAAVPVQSSRYASSVAVAGEEENATGDDDRVLVHAFDGAKAGDDRDDNGLQMKFCWCPAGKFTIGSPATEPGRDADEAQVEISIARGFWLSTYEVTQDEYQRLMGDNPSWFSPSGGGKDKVKDIKTALLPVERVSWNDAMAFCRKLTDQERAAGRLPTDCEYTLPSEAQWEYACRAGTRTATAFAVIVDEKVESDSLGSDQANFNGEEPYNGAAAGKNMERPVEVGSFAANAWGLYDMHGNVWEWCRDGYRTELPRSSDPPAPDDDDERVMRGGSWYVFGKDCRSASRSHEEPRLLYDDLGFRVAIVHVDR